MLKAYKYRLLPTESQQNDLEKFFGCVRFVYNLGLETKIASWTAAKVNLTCIDLNKQLKELKDTTAPWLHDCVAQSLQMALRNLDNAYTNFFRGGGSPRFKKKYSRQSIQFPQNIKILDNKVHIPKLKWVEFINHRPIGNGLIKTVTVSKTPTGKYFISLLIDNQDELPKKKPIEEKTSVGIDVGLKTFATLSDGREFHAPKFFRSQLRKLRIEQRKLSRQFQKGKRISNQSIRWQKQKIKIAKLHEKITNQRKDFLQKTSSIIISNYDTICLENLNIQGMQKNKNLAKAVSDVGWASFIQMLEYKATWRGTNIIYIGRFDPSSKICSTCGNINNALKLHQRQWECAKCNTIHDRDKNASLNIKNFGLRAQPSIGNVSY